MTDISDAQVDELLREAEQRLQKGPVSSAVAAAPKAAGLKSQVDISAPQPPAATTSKEKLSVRAPQTKTNTQSLGGKVSTRIQDVQTSSTSPCSRPLRDETQPHPAH